MGTNCFHILESSYLDKYHPLETSVSELAMVSVGPNQGEWQQVQKKKGKKGKIINSYITRPSPLLLYCCYFFSYVYASLEGRFLAIFSIMTLEYVFHTWY